MKVWKVTLDIGRNTFDLPRGAKVLYVAEQHGLAAAWVLVDDAQPFEKMSIILAGTSHDLPADVGAHVGTLLVQDGNFVFHAFEVKK